MHRDTSAHFSSKYPLPILLVSKPLWCLLHTTSSSSIGLIHLNPDPNTRWVVSDRPLLNSLIPDRMSRYYRRWTDARPERKVLKEPVPPEATERKQYFFGGMISVSTPSKHLAVQSQQQKQ